MHKSYKAKRSRRPGIRRVVTMGIVLLLIFVAAIIGVRHVYYDNLKAVNSSTKVTLVTIEAGTSTNTIANTLQKDGLIRSGAVFEWYVRSQNLHTQLQAGTYALMPNMSVQQIVDILTNGKIATNLVTMLPAQRIDQIRGALINAGFSASSVDSALNPNNYPDAEALVDKPTSANLEGYLYPDSFQKDQTTSPTLIISESLAEMAKQLTPDIRSAFAQEGLSVYRGITLASIVEQEVSNQSDRAQAAQVFLSRLKLNMSLGSDVTAFYGAIVAGAKPSTTYDSPYNTLLHKGLPPGPISNVSASSLQAVAHPANTNWLFFVTGDNGVTYFSNTVQQHDAFTQQYCHKLCSSTN